MYFGQFQGSPVTRGCPHRSRYKSVAPGPWGSGGCLLDEPVSGGAEQATGSQRMSRLTCSVLLVFLGVLASGEPRARAEAVAGDKIYKQALRATVFIHIRQN